MFTRRLSDGRTLTLEVGEHPDEPGTHAALATIDGTLTAWGRPMRVRLSPEVSEIA